MDLRRDNKNRKKSDCQAILSLTINNLANARCALNKMGDTEEGENAQRLYDIVENIDEAMSRISRYQVDYI